MDSYKSSGSSRIDTKSADPAGNSDEGDAMTLVNTRAAELRKARIRTAIALLMIIGLVIIAVDYDLARWDIMRSR